MLKMLKNQIQSIGKSLDGPVFVKPYQGQDKIVDELLTFAENCDVELQDQIHKEVAFIKYGDVGEQNVEYELKHSFIPMMCIHDVTLQYKETRAQFDFILITSKCIFVLETKKLNGNIEVTKNSDFIRIFKNRNGKTLKKEGMYSPITQNERHVEVLSRMLKDAKLIRNLPIIPLVVMANPKSIINDKYAPKVTKKKIIKSDQLKNKIKEIMQTNVEFNFPIVSMEDVAKYIVNNSIETENTYLNKYKSRNESPKAVDNKLGTIAEVDGSDDFSSDEIMPNEENVRNRDAIVEAMKEYRLNKSRELGIKPYFIFNNKQMDEIIDANLLVKEDLMNIKGFAEKKIEQYGEDIISILRK